MAFFSGSWNAKLDEKGRFVLPSALRYGLVEKGELQFFLGLSLGGCLAIYTTSDIETMVEKFQKKQHLVKYQPFFTTFFSSLKKATLDKVGRLSIPPFLRQAASIQSEITLAGVLSKIEIWPKEVHDKKIQSFLQGGSGQALAQEAFALLAPEENSAEKSPLSALLKTPSSSAESVL